METNTRGTLLLTVSGAAGQLLGFFYRAALTRLIRAENMGLYQLILPVYAVIQSLSYARLSVVVSRLTAEYCATGRWQMVRTVLGAGAAAVCTAVCRTGTGNGDPVGSDPRLAAGRRGCFCCCPASFSRE